MTMNTPNPNPSPELREALEASLAKRSVPTMDPPYTAAFNAALDMVARDTAEARTLSPQTLPAPGEVELREAFSGVMRAEVVDAGAWSLHLHFGRGDGARDRMRAASSLLASIVTATPTLTTVAAANDEGVARKWFPHLCWAGEPMREGQFREPWPMDEERTALAKAIFDGWYEGNEDWDSPHNDVIQQRAYFAADAAIRLLSQGGGKA